MSQQSSLTQSAHSVRQVLTAYTGQIIHTAANIGFSPVSLAAWQTYYGAYFNETFDLTNRLSLTAGGRYNLAAIDMADLFGTAPISAPVTSTPVSTQ
jgi:hypothetical protein